MHERKYGCLTKPIRSVNYRDLLRSPQRDVMLEAAKKPLYANSLKLHSEPRRRLDNERRLLALEKPS